MKFTDGFWQLREGVTLQHAIQIYEAEHSDHLKLLAVPKVIRHRGDTLNTPTFNLKIDSPLNDVLRVIVTHHIGSPASLRFALQEGASQTTFSEDDSTWRIRAGKLEAVINKGTEWRIDFKGDGELLTSSAAKSLAYADVQNQDGSKSFFISQQLNLGVGELVYGLGEHFTPVIKNGQVIDMWNLDGGTSSEQAYKNVPFYLTNKGYGVFVNNTGRVSFEVGTEAVERVQFSVQSEDLEYLVIYGPTPKEIISKYTALTGRAPALPEWSFGLWLSTSFLTDYDEATVNKFVDEMAKRDIPLSVFHFDCFWMREFHWCDFEWDPRTFPDPKAMLARLRTKGVKISLWINPYIAQASSIFDEAKSSGYLLKRADGSVWQWLILQIQRLESGSSRSCAHFWRWASTLLRLISASAFQRMFNTSMGPIPSRCIIFMLSFITKRFGS